MTYPTWIMLDSRHYISLEQLDHEPDWQIFRVRTSESFSSWVVRHRTSRHDIPGFHTVAEAKNYVAMCVGDRDST